MLNEHNKTDSSPLAAIGPPKFNGAVSVVRERFSALQAKLAHELNPSGAIESAIVDDIARRIAQVEFADDVLFRFEDEAVRALGDVGIDDAAAVRATVSQSAMQQ